MTSVGVTGHRVLADVQTVTRDIDAALTQVGRSYPAPFVVYSSLAEGADRLVARRAIALLDADLVVVLPMSQADYVADFGESGSLAEFLELQAQARHVVELSSPSMRATAYEAAGRYILNHTDLLMAVWDGRPSRGQGGTAQIVAEARQRQIPVVWIRALRRATPCNGRRWRER